MRTPRPRQGARGAARATPEPSAKRSGAGRDRGNAGAAAEPTRDRLIRSAREVLERGGYAAASVLAIAERAGVSAGALYRHFPSKADLVVEVLRSAGRHELDEMHAAATRADGFAARLEAVIATYARRSLRNRRLSWALVYEPVDPLVDAERLAHRRRYCRGMAELVRAGIVAGEFPSQNADLTAAAIVGAIAETLVGPLSPVGGETASDDEVIASLLRFCRRGVGVADRAALRPVRARGR